MERNVDGLARRGAGALGDADSVRNGDGRRGDGLAELRAFDARVAAGREHGTERFHQILLDLCVRKGEHTVKIS